MRKFMSLILVAGLSASPAMAQVAGFSAPEGSRFPTTFAVTTSATAPAGSFFNADGKAQMAAHKARWARIEAKKLNKAQTKVQ